MILAHELRLAPEARTHTPAENAPADFPLSGRGVDTSSQEWQHACDDLFVAALRRDQPKGCRETVRAIKSRGVTATRGQATAVAI